MFYLCSITLMQAVECDRRTSANYKGRILASQTAEPGVKGKTKQGFTGKKKTEQKASSSKLEIEGCGVFLVQLS